MAFDGNQARFTIDGLPSEDANGNRGVVVANGATITLQLEVIPSGALSATFQLFDAADPSSPLASLNAPVVNFTGSGTPLQLLTDPDTQVAIFDFPAVGIEAYLVRCTVATSAGPVVFERCVVSRGGVSALRKTFPAESQEFESRGWSDELNRMVDAIEGAMGGDMETTYAQGGAITALDVSGGNNLLWDSAVPDPIGLGLFGIAREEGSGELTILKAPAQVDDSANDGTALILVTGGGSNQTTPGTGQAGTQAGSLTLGGAGAISAGGAGSAASGAGTPGADGGDGGRFDLNLSNGGAGGAGDTADVGGTGGLSGTLTVVCGKGGPGGAAGASGDAGDGGQGGGGSFTSPEGGDGGDGTAGAAAGAGANAESWVFQGGPGGVAGADGGGGGADGGDGASISLLGGNAGAASGGGANGDAGPLTLDAGTILSGSARGALNLGIANASAVNIGVALRPIPMAGIPQLPTFTVATVPNPTTFVRGMIFVSDETGGAVPAYSDGTNWRRFSDGVIVS